MGRVDNKVVIVTGAASGLGAADARLLASHGAKVVLTDINETAGKAIAKEIDAQFVRQDVADEQGWRDLIAGVSTASSTTPASRSRPISKAPRPMSGHRRSQSISKQLDATRCIPAASARRWFMRHSRAWPDSN